jgi:hypothetical protein
MNPQDQAVNNFVMAHPVCTTVIVVAIAASVCFWFYLLWRD